MKEYCPKCGMFDGWHVAGCPTNGHDPSKGKVEKLTNQRSQLLDALKKADDLLIKFASDPQDLGPDEQKEKETWLRIRKTIAAVKVV
jgi:hypothetical protein